MIEYIDYDIQTTDPSIVEKYDLKKIRIGDVINGRRDSLYGGSRGGRGCRTLRF